MLREDNVSWQNKKILVTGASGFVGSNLVHHLVRMGVKPHILLRKQSRPWRIKGIASKLITHYVDMVNEDEVRGAIREIKPKIVFHTAAYGGAVFETDLNLIMGANFIGSVNLVNACCETGCEVFVNTGSSSEYGIKNTAMNENDPLEPVTNYGVAKAAFTLYCQALAKREGISIPTLRLFSPYGYYEDGSRLIASVILSCLKGENPRVSSPGSVRDFIFIEDTVDAFVKAVEQNDKTKLQGTVCNIGKQHSVGEIVNAIIELTGSRVEPLWNALPNPRIEPEKWEADISRASAQMNWKPANTLRQGLGKTIKWFESNLDLYEKELIGKE
jgi:nucleoside-diphosphate-sugar epimerase